MRKTPFRLALIAAALTVVACGGGNADTGAGGGPAVPKPVANPDQAINPPDPTHPDSDKVTWKKDASFAKCHNDVKTGADLVAGVKAMGAGCAVTMKLHKVGDTVQGSRQNLDKAQVIPLKAEAGHCYRVYGLSEDALQDLDIAMMDSAGKECAEDGSDSPDAVLLEDGAVCFTATDDVSINVAAGSGTGKYVVQIWGD